MDFLNLDITGKSWNVENITRVAMTTKDDQFGQKLILVNYNVYFIISEF